MPRKRPEWIGKTPDTKIPDDIRLKVFRDHNGRCHISGRKIMPSDVWDLDHVIALINGGENRESNLAPAIRDKHRGKTALDVKAKAKGDRAAKRVAGIRTKRHNWPKRPMIGFESNVRQLYGDLEEAMECITDAGRSAISNSEASTDA